MSRELTTKRRINARVVGIGWAGDWPIRDGLTQEWWELDKQGIDQYEMDEQETAMRDEAADWQEMINGRWISRRLIKLDQQRFESWINRRLNGWGVDEQETDLGSEIARDDRRLTVKESSSSFWRFCNCWINTCLLGVTRKVGKNCFSFQISLMNWEAKTGL